LPNQRHYIASVGACYSFNYSVWAAELVLFFFALA